MQAIAGVVEIGPIGDRSMRCVVVLEGLAVDGELVVVDAIADFQHRYPAVICSYRKRHELHVQLDERLVRGLVIGLGIDFCILAMSAAARHHGGRDLHLDVADRREVLVQPVDVAFAEIGPRQEALDLGTQHVVDALAARCALGLRLGVRGGAGAGRPNDPDDLLIGLVRRIDVRARLVRSDVRNVPGMSKPVPPGENMPAWSTSGSRPGGFIALAIAVSTDCPWARQLVLALVIFAEVRSCASAAE